MIICTGMEQNTLKAQHCESLVATDCLRDLVSCRQASARSHEILEQEWRALEGSLRRGYNKRRASTLRSAQRVCCAGRRTSSCLWALKGCDCDCPECFPADCKQTLPLHIPMSASSLRSIDQQRRQRRTAHHVWSLLRSTLRLIVPRISHHLPKARPRQADGSRGSPKTGGVPAWQRALRDSQLLVVEAVGMTSSYMTPYIPPSGEPFECMP